MTIEEELQTIEEPVHTMVALAHQLRERMGRKAMVDKEVQTMTTEQPMATEHPEQLETLWEGVPDEELDTDTEIGLRWD